MARTRFQNLAPDRQEAILSAAADEFAVHGYAGASLSRIIEAAGISKGTLYYYFDHKADLFASVLEEAMGRMLADVGALEVGRLEASEFWDSLWEYGRRSVDLLQQDVWYVRLGMAIHRLREEPEAAAAVEPVLEWSRRLMREVLVRGRELGMVRTDMPLELLVEVAMAVDEAAGRWLVEHVAEYPGEGMRELVDAQMDLMRDMLDAKNEGWER